jgi:hypothetical protein
MLDQLKPQTDWLAHKKNEVTNFLSFAIWIFSNSKLEHVKPQVDWLTYKMFHIGDKYVYMYE